MYGQVSDGTLCILIWVGREWTPQPESNYVDPDAIISFESNMPRLSVGGRRPRLAATGIAH